MAKTNPSYTIETTFSGINISSAASVYQFTAAADELVQFIVKLTNAAGNDDYIIYLTRQWEGAGAVSVALGKTTVAAASGETVIEFTTMQMQVKSGDVVEVMIDGPAGDISVNGLIRIVANNPSILEQSDVLSDTTPFDGADIADILTDTGEIGTAGVGLSDLGGMSTAMKAEVNVEADTALTDYDPPTRTEATADKDEILAAITANAALVWAYGTRTLTSFGVLVASIWTYVTRTLTQTAEEILSVTAGADIAVLRGDTLSIPITAMGTLALRTSLYFTVRKTKSLPDTDSEIQVEETLNLLYLSGASPVSPIIATDGTLTVDDETDGDITVLLKPRASKELTSGDDYSYDVQVEYSTGVVTTLRSGTFTITQDVTRAIS